MSNPLPLFPNTPVFVLFRNFPLSGHETLGRNKSSERHAEKKRLRDSTCRARPGAVRRTWSISLSFLSYPGLWSKKI